MDKIKSMAFVSWLDKQLTDKCGYIMGTSGQTPTALGIGSWYLRQYADRDEYSAAQEAKAKYWFKYAPRVFDCAGLAEGAVVELLGLKLKDVNTKARYIYSDWCRGANGTDMDKMPRVPGTAIFKTNSTPSGIHHIGYLEKPIVDGDVNGDWYVIEAKGVLYGVVRTRLNGDKKWNCWGQMVKYFDYSKAMPKPQAAKTGDIRIVAGSVNLRVGPGTEYPVATVAHKGDVYEQANNPSGWYPVRVSGDVLWVSSNPDYTEVVK